MISISKSPISSSTFGLAYAMENEETSSQSYSQHGRMYQWEVALVRNRTELVDKPQLLRGCPTRNIQKHRASRYRANGSKQRCGRDYRVISGNCLHDHCKSSQYWLITRSRRRQTNEDAEFRQRIRFDRLASHLEGLRYCRWLTKHAVPNF